MKINRWSAYKFKNGKIAQNRIVVPPMASQTADINGFVTDKTIQHYKNLNSSGAGLIFVEYSFINQTGKGEKNQLGANLDEQLSGLREISSIIHSGGALAGLQIVHAGSKTSPQITGQSLQAPSSIPVPTKDWQPEIPTEMSHNQIQEWITDFTASALRAQRAGFDFVEIHAAHGYGLNQWLSPLTNKRMDHYGGDVKGRSKLLMEIITSIKSAAPTLLVAVRLPAQDHLDGGLQISDMILVTQQLEVLGVDLIDVSSGIGGWRRPEGRLGEGYLVNDAARIKAEISLPVIGVGGIESGATIDNMLMQDKIDFAAVGRAILKNPTTWYQQHLAINYSEVAV